MAQDTVSAAARDSSARGDSTAARSSDTLGVPRAPGRIDCARPPLARRTSCRRERKCGKHRQARAVQRTTSQHDNLPRLSGPRSRARCHRGPIATRPRCHPDCAMLQSSGLANTPCWACHFEGPPPKHPNDPPGTGFQEAETKGPKTLAAIDVPFSESCRSRITPPTRPISHAARNSPVAHDCVVGPGVPPTWRAFKELGCPTGSNVGLEDKRQSVRCPTAFALARTRPRQLAP